MSPEEIMAAYDVLAQDLQTKSDDYAAAIGNSQRSLGPLAERVASPSGQTAGLANYTYNRTMRPVVDSLTTSLVKQGRAEGLEKLLADKLREAKNNYENAKNTSVANNNNNNNNGINTSGGKTFNGREATDEENGWDTEFEGVNVGWGELSDLWTHEYNFTIPGTNIEVELGGWNEELRKGKNDGQYYIWNVPQKKIVAKIEGNSGVTGDKSRWWTKH